MKRKLSGESPATKYADIYCLLHDPQNRVKRAEKAKRRKPPPPPLQNTVLFIVCWHFLGIKSQKAGESFLPEAYNLSEIAGNTLEIIG